MFQRGRAFLVLTAAVFSLAAQPAVPASIRHVSEYDISLGLLPIATASFASEFNAKDYKIAGSFKSAGIVNLFSRISADTDVTGVVQGKKLQTGSYKLTYTRGKKTRIYTVGYRNGDVVSTAISPEPARVRPAGCR